MEKVNYFVYCPECDITTGLSMEQALKAAQDHIDHFLEDDTWIDGVENVIVGKVTHEPKMINYVAKPTDIDENGYSKSLDMIWNKRWDYHCEYTISENK